MIIRDQDGKIKSEIKDEQTATKEGNYQEKAGGQEGVGDYRF